MVTAGTDVISLTDPWRRMSGVNVTVYSVDDSVVKERCSNGRGARSFQNVLADVGLFVLQRRCDALIQHIYDLMVDKTHY